MRGDATIGIIAIIVPLVVIGGIANWPAVTLYILSIVAIFIGGAAMMGAISVLHEIAAYLLIGGAILFAAIAALVTVIERAAESIVLAIRPPPVAFIRRFRQGGFAVDEYADGTFHVETANGRHRYASRAELDAALGTGE